MLKAEQLEGVIVVRDTEGGIWWPNAEAQAEIEASEAPEETAVAIADTEPMRGHWAS